MSRHRAVCPVCRESVRASWAGDELLLAGHAAPPIAGLVVLDAIGRARRCRGGGRRVSAAPAAPANRPISYEETLRVIDALMGVTA